MACHKQKYVLTYFDIKGRAEPARMLFAAAGVKYEDKRIPEYTETDYSKLFTMPPDQWKYSKEYLELQPSTPFGEVPTLHVDGEQIAFMKSIMAYLGNKLGFAGKTDLDKAKVAMIYEATEEIFTGTLQAIMTEADADKKAALLKKYTEETLPKYFDNISKLAGSKGHFVADQMTYADIGFVHFSANLAGLQVDPHLEKYPKIKAIVDKVEKHPKIAKWLKERPNTLL